MGRYGRRSSALQMILFFVGLAMVLFWSTGRVVNYITYNIDVGGRLKRAADANTIELAQQELDGAIAEMERRGYTGGYTSVIYNTPDEDIGFWYRNVTSAQKELVELDPNSTQLEKTNVLMKLRETLLDGGEKGMSVTAPEGISVYPNNKLYFWGGSAGWFFCLFFGCWWFIREN